VEANVVAYGWPLFAALWAALVYRNRRTLAEVPLAVVGFAGVALILGSGGGFAGSGGGSAGYAAAFGSAFALALCIGGFSPWVWSAEGPGAWVASVYAGVGPMAGGFLLWGLAIDRKERG
jgi:drug/metabolite transporter (DMT)-like permease